jgi:phospholipase C
VIHQPSTVPRTTGFHHGTVIRTLCAKYDLPPLNDRDRTAPDLSDVFNLDTPRDPKTWPDPLLPLRAPKPDPSSPELAHHPLNGLERHIVGLTMAAFNEVGEIPATLGAAHALMTRMAKAAFGQ